MVGFGNNNSSMDTLLHQRNLGGVLLFAHNINSPEQLLQTLTNNYEIAGSCKTP